MSALRVSAIVWGMPGSPDCADAFEMIENLGLPVEKRHAQEIENPAEGTDKELAAERHSAWVIQEKALPMIEIVTPERRRFYTLDALRKSADAREKLGAIARARNGEAADE